MKLSFLIEYCWENALKVFMNYEKLTEKSIKLIFLKSIYRLKFPVHRSFVERQIDDTPGTINVRI